MGWDGAAVTGKSAKLREVVEAVLDGWYADGPIDWEDFYDRCERFGVDVGDQLDGPTPRRIRAMVRELRRASA